MKFEKINKSLISTERMKRMNVRVVFRCCECGTLSFINTKNIEVMSPPGYKWYCKKCSGTGKARLLSE